MGLIMNAWIGLFVALLGVCLLGYLAYRSMLKSRRKHEHALRERQQSAFDRQVQLARLSNEQAETLKRRVAGRRSEPLVRPMRPSHHGKQKPLTIRLKSQASNDDAYRAPRQPNFPEQLQHMFTDNGNAYSSSNVPEDLNRHSGASLFDGGHSGGGGASGSWDSGSSDSGGSSSDSGSSSGGDSGSSGGGSND